MSLADALADAHSIDDLDEPDPLARAALYGLLSAVVLDLVDLSDVSMWESQWKAGSFARPVIDAYFHEHGHRFDLFDGQAPFAQVGGLTPTSGGPKPVSLLVPEVATGNNVPLFGVGPESRIRPLTPAEASRRLLATLAYDTAAIKTGVRGDPQVKSGKTTGNPIAPLGQLGYAVPLGRTLFETLLLQCPVGQREAGDLPLWRREPLSPQWSQRMPAGIRDLLTWPSRRIRLVPEIVDDEVRVTGVIVAAGDRLAEVPHFEPRTLWHFGASKGGLIRRPRRLASDRAGWRGLAALTSLRDERDTDRTSHLLTQVGMLVEDDVLPLAYPLRVLVVGVVYGNMSAVVDHVFSDEVPLPVAGLLGSRPEVRATLGDLVTAADGVRRALNDLDTNLRRSRGGDRVDSGKGYPPGERFVARLDPLARRALLRLRAGTDEEDVLLDWDASLWDEAWMVADPLLSEAPPTTFLGRGGSESGERGEMRQQLAEAYFRARLQRVLPNNPAARAASTATETSR